MFKFKPWWIDVIVVRATGNKVLDTIIYIKVSCDDDVFQTFNSVTVRVCTYRFSSGFTRIGSTIHEKLRRPTVGIGSTYPIVAVSW